jgi:hypothetical protein
LALEGEAKKYVARKVGASRCVVIAPTRLALESSMIYGPVIFLDASDEVLIRLVGGGKVDVRPHTNREARQ